MKLLVAERDLGLGDFVTGIPAYRALARAFPDHRRVLVASPAYRPLLDASFELVQAIPHRADIAVNLHGKGPQSTAALRATQPRRLIAFDDATWGPREHEVSRWCRLLREHGIPADPSDLDLRLDAPRTGAVVIHPGAASGARRWPVERWAAVAGRLDDVVVTAGPGERELAERVGGRIVAGDLLTLARTIKGARCVLCGDTGVAHLATALGTPSVVLFGPTPPSEWGPPPDRPQHVALWKGRRGDPHADAPDPGLLEITVDEVLQRVMKLMRPFVSRTA